MCLHGQRYCTNEAFALVVCFQTVQHGFPNKPTALAWDPSLRLMIIGTASGAIKVYPFALLAPLVCASIFAFFLPVRYIYNLVLARQTHRAPSRATRWRLYISILLILAKNSCRALSREKKSTDRLSTIHIMWMCTNYNFVCAARLVELFYLSRERERKNLSANWKPNVSAVNIVLFNCNYFYDLLYYRNRGKRAFRHARKASA